MKTIAAACAALTLMSCAVMSCGSALANDIDLSAWTCRKFQSAAKDDVTIILAWLNGFYKQQDDPPVIDTSQFTADAKKLNDYCTAHPDVGLITATDKLFQKQ
ncbi:MAG TPA: HdeA/HdeB family chaperone [Xanthobacteraceae bacterium]|jgi:acid stress chaperone HdeB|nr:HdeA/HdeB family chaperone [Xanthobacteraceae bacterium]